MTPFNQSFVVFCLNVSGTCFFQPKPRPFHSVLSMTYIYQCLTLAAAITLPLFFFTALDTASLSLTSTGSYCFCFCLSYLLTSHHRFGIDLCWPRMPLHSSGDERLGAGRGVLTVACLPPEIFLGHILAKTPGVLNLSYPQCWFTQTGKWRRV